jgi:hypothetical protein
MSTIINYLKHIEAVFIRGIGYGRSFPFGRCKIHNSSKIKWQYTVHTLYKKT